MDRNARALLIRSYLGIADAKNQRRAAYKFAADEIVAWQAEEKITNAAIARAIGRSADYVRLLLKWRDSGFEAETPFLMDEQATTRASVSHAKKVLREQSTDEIETILDDLPEEAIEKIAEATERTKVTRKLYPDKPKPSHEKATTRAKAKDTEDLKKNQWEANARLGATVGSARAAVRAVVLQYQEFVALVDDEGLLEDGRDRVTTLRADVDLALGEVLEGSIEQAFSNLLSEEVG